MSNLFLTKPMSVWTPYGILVLGCLAVLIMILCMMGADSWRRYRYSGEKSGKIQAIYWFLGGTICLLMGLFILLRRGWLMLAAFLIVIGVTYQTVGGGIRNQAEKE